MISISNNRGRKSIGARVLDLNWGLLILICVMAAIGCAALYSAGSGDWDKWAGPQFSRFLLGLAIMTVIALVDIKFWFFMAWPIWVGGVLLLVVVEIVGHIGMGAQRWIDLGFIKLQPSELIKLAVVLMLARYYHLLPSSRVSAIKSLGIPAVIIGVPVGLVVLQPDLGTSLMIIMAGVAVIFLAGLSKWYFLAGAALGAVLAPAYWFLMMHDYQKDRVMTFLNPESDPLGKGYHITQSKIAIGSGGFGGKGYMEGTQSRLNFLPEKQTDFIFTLWAEEWGFIGGIALLGVLAAIFFYGYWIAFHCRHRFGYLLSLGLMINFAIYAFVNIGMVMGLLPVVGAPLPFVSYGGTSMLAVMIGFGLMMSAWVYRERALPRSDID